MTNRRRTNKIILIVLAVCLVLLCGCAGISALLDTKDEKEGDAAPTASPSRSTDSATAAGIPPKPDAATQAAYIADLKAINPAIVGKHSVDTMVNRGRDQCSSLSGTKDHAKLVDLTNKRFSAPGHADGFGTATAEKILRVVHKRLCPSYPMP
ncbi:MAG: hypothetical protein JXA67_08125 [Micromonosporaceae bacterium]|nr:hypothetical protein [Micromonosporaceae bacterium]